MVELADTLDLGSSGKPCRFKSCQAHHNSSRPPAGGCCCFRLAGFERLVPTVRWTVGRRRPRRRNIYFCHRQKCKQILSGAPQRQNSTKGHLTPQSGAKSTEGAVLPFPDRTRWRWASIRAGAQNRSASCKMDIKTRTRIILRRKAAPNRPKELFFLSKLDPRYWALRLF